MDESLDGPHQTWVGPQPASTETLPVPPPSHTNYAPRPNLASPGERVVLDATEMSSFFNQCNVPSVSGRLEQKSEQMLEG